MSEVKQRKRAASKEILDGSAVSERHDDLGDSNGIAYHDAKPTGASKGDTIKKNADEVGNSWLNGDFQPFSVNIEVDGMAVALFVLGLFSRMWRLEEPRSIVFDELHYGKFASLYMKNTFFFDSHPPLGKQLIALAGYLAGFDGNAQFDRIGGSYSASVPLWALRFVPAFFGSLLVPTTYHLATSLGLARSSAALAAILMLLENSLLTQSRFILMESILICFAALGLLSLLKFRQSDQRRPFSFGWWFWLVLSVAFLTCALCVKYIGMFSILLAVYIMARDFWNMLGNSAISDAKLWLHFMCRSAVTVVVPTCIYLGVFYVHLNTLTKAGPHDNIMTSAFQASLEGGLASITKGQPLAVVHGSQVTLRHTHGRACWLHSHPHVYPIKYPDGRGSSHQQQVTCYSFKDVNNWWIVKRPDIKDIVVSEPPDQIKHGDIVQLIHGMTSRALNSHDVASPMSPQHQEVSCYINYNISYPSQNLWRVDILNKDTEGDTWHTIHSHVRLVHVNTSQALKYKMLLVNQENVQDHVYSSDPMEWPLMTRGIAYWVSPTTNAQIHLIGNLAIWYTGTLCLLLYMAIFSFYLLRRHRLVYDIPNDAFEKFKFGGELCVVGYAMHVVPYFFADRTLFLHHYLPALLYKVLVLVVVLEHIDFVLWPEWRQKSPSSPSPETTNSSRTLTPRSVMSAER
ncbi:hypothetical protein HPB47_023716 [Ixodes persulcatus]|uniref:Uncharacterized protein n=1 Tax=Ixodes persulcatus TaxID=34615 RepID=A0AC60Q9B7_IXOPE|nr:hypothetical protein HPB47_023716 [Ixodes persulcatus]